MLVYGDQSEIADPRKRISELSGTVRRIATLPPGIRRHAELVGLLDEAGRLWQGLADAIFDETGCDGLAPGTTALADWVHALARAVCGSWDERFNRTSDLPAPPKDGEWPSKVELRSPEGFAFYSLYPEAYIEAARRVELSAPPSVIGIRSIGTTLGAVVAAAVGAPPAVTVRPHGDEFSRRVAIAPELEEELLRGERHYIIVDEGPGMSGSSFGAVADWLEQRGISHERIAFLPSHSGDLGPRSSNAHRQRWATAQRQPADFGDKLPSLLEHWLEQDLGPLERPLEEISGGCWRSRLYLREDEWPAAMPMWERRKFLAHADDGTLLVKFAGLGSIGDRKFAMARALHAAGFVAEPIALVHGFLAERWMQDAVPLAQGEKPIEGLAAYLAARARLFPAAEHDGAKLRDLLDMIRRNVSLAAGEEGTEELGRWFRETGALEQRVVRIRTDNRLDRHEWLRSTSGRLIKTDALDHHAAHDLIGCQDLAWDVAGAISEFELNPREAQALIAATERASGRDVDPQLLGLYRLAYAAFRLGQASMAAEMCSEDDPEKLRLRKMASRYLTELSLLLQPTSTATRRDSLVG